MLQHLKGYQRSITLIKTGRLNKKKQITEATEDGVHPFISAGVSEPTAVILRLIVVCYITFAASFHCQPQRAFDEMRRRTHSLAKLFLADRGRRNCVWPACMAHVWVRSVYVSWVGPLGRDRADDDSQGKNGTRQWCSDLLVNIVTYNM